MVNIIVKKKDENTNGEGKKKKKIPIFLYIIPLCDCAFDQKYKKISKRKRFRHFM